MKICSKFTGEHPCRSVISLKLHCNLVGITLRYGCFPVNFLHIFRTLFTKNTPGGLLLKILTYLSFYYQQTVLVVLKIHLFKNQVLKKNLFIDRTTPPEMFVGNASKNMQQIYGRTPMSKCGS